MIKAKLKKENGEILLYGLSRKNIESLVAGDPISFEGDGFPDTLIIFGETEKDIADQLGYAGLWNAPKEGSSNA